LQRTLGLLKRIFVSYSHADKDFVGVLTNSLGREGFRVWIDGLALRAGDNFAIDIERAINEARFMIVVISRESVKSRWVQREIRSALDRQAEFGELTIIPILVDDSPVPRELGHLLCVDFGRGFDEASRDVIRALDQGRARLA
jgi:hypothetical protein